MNKNRLKALLHNQEPKNVILSTRISSNTIIKNKQIENTVDRNLDTLVNLSSNTVIKTKQIENTVDRKLDTLVNLSSNTVIKTKQTENTLVGSSDIRSNIDNNNINADQYFQNILRNKLSKEYNFKTEEINDLLKLNICNKNFYDEYHTTIKEFSYLVTEIITLLGATKMLLNTYEDDCLFHSFSTYLNIDQKQLREDSVNYILMKWNQFKDFAIHLDSLKLYNSSDDYKSSMLTDNSSGDYLTLFALCELYQLNAIIIVTEGIQLYNIIKINIGSSKTILINAKYDAK